MSAGSRFGDRFRHCFRGDDSSEENITAQHNADNILVKSAGTEAWSTKAAATYTDFLGGSRSARSDVLMSRFLFVACSEQQLMHPSIKRAHHQLVGYGGEATRYRDPKDYTDEDAQPLNGGERRKQRHRRYIALVPSAKSPRRLGPRVGSRSTAIRICTIVVAFMLAAMLRTYLLLETQPCTKVHVLVLPDGVVDKDSRFHNLTAVAHALANNGLRVTLRPASMFTERIGHDDALTMFSTYDAILLQAPSATMLADFAAYSNTSVVRFVGVREAGVNDNIPPHRERPELVVLGSDTRGVLHKEPGLWFTPHIELPVGSVDNQQAPQYWELVQRILPLCKAGSQMRETREEYENITKDIMGLVIIAKNEALRISDPLLSMKEHIDYWTVLDANSIDNTTAVVKQLMAGRPGHLMHHDFTDFSTARNAALKSHGRRTKYAVMLDADMSIPAAWRLRVTLQRVAQLCAAWDQHPLCFQAFQVPAILEGIKFFTIRVFPTAGAGTLDGWHYLYPVHEIPQHLKLPSSVSGDTVVKLQTVDIMTAADPTQRHAARAKELDLPLLREERQKRPEDARVAFYLAQTLHTINMLPEALDAYEDRVQMGGWYEEVFESLLRKGKILTTMKKDPMLDLMRAAETSPYRAEPYMVMAWHHSKMSASACNTTGWHDSACYLRHRVAALHYAKRASERPKPRKDLMFVDLSTYTEHALGAVVEHAFQVAWKTQGAAYMGNESASSLSTYRGRHSYNRTRVHDLVNKYKELAALHGDERGVMWAKPSA